MSKPRVSGHGVMLPDGITEGEQKFVHLYLEGKSLPDAIRGSGLQYKDAKKGWDLIRMPHIQKYVNEQKLAVQQVLKDRFKDDQLFKAQKLMDGIKDLEENITDRTRVASWLAIKSLISELNKMFGHYAPVEHLNATYDINEEIRKTKDIMPEFKLIHMPKQE